jgi:hypothetical protein
MDFHQLLAKMQELDTTPAPVAQPIQSEECGMPPVSSMPPAHNEPPPPSMSVNLNAQGMDNIKDMFNLWMKVNPDMMPKVPMPMPAVSNEPSIMSIKPQLPLLKMLPDFDADNDDKAGGEMDIDQDSEMDKDDNAQSMIMKMSDEPQDDDKGSQPGGLAQSLDRDGDGDHDMDDHDMEPDNGDDEEEKKEAYANEPDECEADIDYMNNTLAGGMNGPKGTYPKVAVGDNPMQKVKESGDLRSQIRAELLRRLEEAKGAK